MLKENEHIVHLAVLGEPHAQTTFINATCEMGRFKDC